jgi:bacillithiol biosynthesis cysteine-adding enzyme BshC
LVIVEADDPALKELMIPIFEKELIDQESFKAVSKTLEDWREEYKIQVTPREINLFYLKDKLRQRIIAKGNAFAIDETDLEFSEKEIIKELEDHPERFSPNAVMRPLYQEVVLPNLAYIGGAGELSYWFQLKDYFESQDLPLPIIWLRNSVLLLSEKQVKKIKNLGRQIPDFFQSKSDLKSQHAREISEIDIDFSTQKEHLKKQFLDLYKLAKQTDPSFEGAVAAQEQKQMNGLEHLEKRLLKAEKRRLNDELNRLTELKEKLFPQENLQERFENFSSFYAEYGQDLIPKLKEELKPTQFGIQFIEFKY